MIVSSLVSFVPYPKAASYQIEPKQSNLVWFGYKPLGVHSGTVQIKAGTITVKNDQLTGGSVQIDMQSIMNTDLAKQQDKDALIGHLKSDDFFGVAQYPTASLVITSVKQLDNQAENKRQSYVVNADLTIKGITEQVVFTAHMQKDANENLHLSSDKFKIDRTLYGIKFKSKSFFEGLGDAFISDDFELELTQMLAKKV